jgi:hypothetical protein
LLLVAALACGPGAVTDSSPGPSDPDTTGTGGGTIQRGTLAVRVQPAPGDGAVLNAAGVSLSGLTVRAQRRFSAEPVRAGTTDAQGVARFDGLLEGSYIVSVERPLSTAEQERLPPDARGLSVLAGGATASVTPPGTVTTVVELVGSRRGSLVLSEVFASYLPVGSVGTEAHYLQLYNQADTTIYLDGMVVFRSAGSMHDALPASACETVNVDERLTSQGVWAGVIKRFPGSGRDYPILPGRSRLLAATAIDHRSVGPGMPDLRNADFEVIGAPSDPDNPLAANMLDVTRNIGFGGMYLNPSVLLGIGAASVPDTNGLEARRLRSPDGRLFNQGQSFLIPRALILDVFGYASADAEEASTQAYQLGLRRCSPFAHPDFERAPNTEVDTRVLRALRRRALVETGQGQSLLMRTGAASRDWELAPPLERFVR